MKYRIKETGVEVVSQGDFYHSMNGLNSYHSTTLNTLGLTLEEIKPEKRKLYAYKLRDALGFFIRFEEREEPKLGRAPQYDIEFEDEK